MGQQPAVPPTPEGGRQRRAHPTPAPKEGAIVHFRIRVRRAGGGYRKDNQPGKETFRTEDVVLSTDFGPYLTTCETELPAGDYTVIPMTWARGEEAGFELSVITRARATLSHLKSLTTSEP